MRNTILTIVCCLSFLLPSQSQDFERDMERVAKAYQGIKDFEIKAELGIYKDWNAPKPSEVQKSEAYKKGDDYLYKMGGMTMLSNTNCVLMVDSDRKLIVYSPKKRGKPQKPLEIKVGEDFMPDVDKMFEEMMEGVEYLGLEGGHKHYRINNANGYLKEVDLYINPQTYLMSKVVYHYDESAYAGSSKVVLEYTKTDLNPTLDGGLFSEKVFIRKVGDEWTPTNPYKGYELIIN